MSSPIDPTSPSWARHHLHASNWPAWLENVLSYAPETGPPPERTYPGYPRQPLPEPHALRWFSLGKALRRRRASGTLASELPPPKALSTVLSHSHRLFEDGHGPCPSAGNLQAMHVYLVPMSDGWLPPGVYYYGRKSHELVRVVAPVSTADMRSDWQAIVPSLRPNAGGGLLILLVSDQATVAAKYSTRAPMLAYLEAGHLMQNLSLVATSQGLIAIPFGAFFEAEVARSMNLPGGQRTDRPGDLLVYAGLLGRPES